MFNIPKMGQFPTPASSQVVFFGCHVLFGCPFALDMQYDTIPFSNKMAVDARFFRDFLVG
jgi:hypothetical protein